ncbi:nuclear transport factor 2 family protein [Zavarzinella formosa]|uniref:nuclear transport factor 2 family protein n=1 Tax=Zavarzinella formosa TaxID=360055 RepID=UPI0002E9112A|nr:nuclear transport factor 2 family protein [Zavarzinella formosa]
MEPIPVNQFIDDLQPAFEAGDAHARTKSPEAANFGLVKAVYEALNQGDLKAFLSMLSEDMELEIVGPPVVPFVGRWKGRAELAVAIPRNFSVIGDLKPEIISVVAQGDTVVVVAREKGRYKPNDRPYETNWVQTYTISGGKVVKMRQVFDSGPFLEAIYGPAIEKPQ